MPSTEHPTEIVLARPPALLPCYARALLPRRRPPGRPLPTRTLRLPTIPREPARLRAYAELCGFHGAFADARLLPATYPQLFAFPLTMRLLTAGDFPHPPLGLVHLANEIEQARPLAADEELGVAVRAGATEPHPRGTAFDVVAVVRDARGAVVWRSTSTYLRRHGAVTAGERAPAEAEPDLNAPTWTESWPLPADLGRRYARVSGDRNPIHLHPLTARPFGFRRPIAHGMWSKARALAALAATLPETFTARVRFRAPAELPSRPTFAAAPSDGGQAFRLTGEDGRPLLTGEITAPV